MNAHAALSLSQCAAPRPAHSLRTPPPRQCPLQRQGPRACLPAPGQAEAPLLAPCRLAGRRVAGRCLRRSATESCRAGAAGGGAAAHPVRRGPRRRRRCRHGMWLAGPGPPSPRRPGCTCLQARPGGGGVRWARVVRAGGRCCAGARSSAMRRCDSTVCIPHAPSRRALTVRTLHHHLLVSGTQEGHLVDLALALCGPLGCGYLVPAERLCGTDHNGAAPAGGGNAAAPAGGRRVSTGGRCPGEGLHAGCARCTRQG